MTQQLLEVDERGRTTLATLRRVRRRHLETDLPDGTVILPPAVVMSEAQARLLAAPEVLAAVTAANARPDAGAGLSTASDSPHDHLTRSVAQDEAYERDPRWFVFWAERPAGVVILGVAELPPL